MNSTQTKSSAPSSVVAMEARAAADGVLDNAGFFTQDDWEFGLDTLQDSSRAALEAHIADGPDDHETAVFLKGYLMNSREIKFTAFED